MNPLDFPSRLVLPTQPLHNGAGSRASSPSFSEALADVASIARDMTAERVSIANQMRRIVNSGDTRQIPTVLTRLQDANARQDVMATVLTKTTSGIDQIVKMQ